MKNVISKIAQIEHDIKLASIQDLTANSEQVIELHKQEKQRTLDALSTLKFQIESLGQVPRRASQLLTGWNDLEIAVKDLGVELPNNAIKLKEEVKKLSGIDIKSLDAIVKSGTSQLNSI